jgi:hypothetical protein
MGGSDPAFLAVQTEVVAADSVERRLVLLDLGGVGTLQGDVQRVFVPGWALAFPFPHRRGEIDRLLLLWQQHQDRHRSLDCHDRKMNQRALPYQREANRKSFPR